MRIRGVSAGFWAAALALAASPSTAQNTSPTTAPGSKPAVRKLTLQEAIATAQRNSKSLGIAAQAVWKARGAVHESRAAFLPTLSADVTLTHLDQGTEAQLGADPAAKITIVKQDQKSATLTAAVPVDIMGMIRAAASLSEYQYVIARLDYNRQTNQLVQDVTAGYYDVLRAHAFVQVADQASSNAEERLRMAEAYLKAGTGTRFDVLRAETELANAKQNVIAARNRVELATAALNSVLGLDQATPLDLAAPPVGSPSGTATDFDAVLREAYSNRPEVLQADTGIKAAQKGFYLASRSQLPSLGLAWNLQHNPDTGAFGRKTSWAAVAKVTLPVFDGGVSGARREQARAGVESAELTKQQALDQVALDARQAHLSLNEAAERLRVAEAAMTQAEEAYRLAQVRYRAGVTMTPGGSPLLEISDAQTALTQAQTNKINAQYDLEIARTRLERAMGRYAYQQDAGPGMRAPTNGVAK